MQSYGCHMIVDLSIASEDPCSSLTFQSPRSGQGFPTCTFRLISTPYSAHTRSTPVGYPEIPAWYSCTHRLQLALLYLHQLFLLSFSWSWSACLPIHVNLESLQGLFLFSAIICSNSLCLLSFHFCWELFRAVFIAVRCTCFSVGSSGWYDSFPRSYFTYTCFTN
jgi:hypothetical protein